MKEELVLFRQYLQTTKRKRKNKRGYSKNTIDTYFQSVLQFFQCCEKKEMTMIFQEDVDEFVAYLRKQNLKTVSINLKLSALHQYLLFLQSTYQKTFSIELPFGDVQKQDYLTGIPLEEEIAQMLTTTQKENDWRANALIDTLAYSGLRVSELREIRVEHVQQTSFSIIGKGEKEREIFFIMDDVRKSWQKYLEVRPSSASPFLFIGKRGRLSRKTIFHILKEYAKKAGINESKIYPHNFRHFFGKYLDQHGYTLTEIKDILGHRSVETTTIYTRRTKEEMREKLNELSNLRKINSES